MKPAQWGIRMAFDHPKVAPRWLTHEINPSSREMWLTADVVKAHPSDLAVRRFETEEAATAYAVVLALKNNLNFANIEPVELT